MSRFLIALFLTTIADTAVSQDWPGLRGPNSDGSAGTGHQLSAAEGAGFSVAWQASIGSGYSGVVVMDGKAVTIFSDGKDDVAAAFEVSMLGTQSLLMIYSDEARFEKMITKPEERPLRLYLDWGRHDLRATREARDVGETNRRFAAFIRERGDQPAGGETPGGFGWGSWRDQTGRLFEALFPLTKGGTIGAQ